MKNLFECKIKYDSVDESGKEISVSEIWLVEAMSFTEVEAKTYKEMENNNIGDLSIDAIKRVKYQELILDEEKELYYKAKVSLIVFDELKGKERKTSINVLTSANDIQEANFIVNKVFLDESYSSTIESISESKICGTWFDVDKFIEDVD